jgi:hypothetical protein
MKYLLLMVLCLSLSKSNFAQQVSNTTNTYQYYIEVNKPQKSKLENRNLVKAISIKSNIVSFKSVSPVSSSYILITKVPITKEVFNNWIKSYEIVVTIFKSDNVEATYIKNKKQQFTKRNKTDKKA